METYNQHLSDPGLVTISMRVNFMGFKGRLYDDYQEWMPHRDVCPIPLCMLKNDSSCRMKVVSLTNVYDVILAYSKTGKFLHTSFLFFILD